MTKEEIKQRIRDIWFEYPDKCSKEAGFPLAFYLFIQNKYPNLLTFRSSGDRYQVIAGWVNEWQRTFCE